MLTVGKIENLFVTVPWLAATTCFINLPCTWSNLQKKQIWPVRSFVEYMYSKMLHPIRSVSADMVLFFFGRCLKTHFQVARLKIDKPCSGKKGLNVRSVQWKTAIST